MSTQTLYWPGEPMVFHHHGHKARIPQGQAFDVESDVAKRLLSRFAANGMTRLPRPDEATDVSTEDLVAAAGARLADAHRLGGQNRVKDRMSLVSRGAEGTQLPAVQEQAAKARAEVVAKRESAASARAEAAKRVRERRQQTQAERKAQALNTVRKGKATEAAIAACVVPPVPPDVPPPPPQPSAEELAAAAAEVLKGAEPTAVAEVPKEQPAKKAGRGKGKNG